jgi:hypothetical protein
MPLGLGRLGWFYPYWFLYQPYWFWRCFWFPWLPRWWWTGIYGPIWFYPYFYPTMPLISKEEEISILEDQEKNA